VWKTERRWRTDGFRGEKENSVMATTSCYWSLRANTVAT
jgi:hypothetical protein